MPARRFYLRLSLFLLPVVLIGLGGVGLGLFCGELLSVKYVARLQEQGKPFVFLPELSDHSYRLKLEGASRRKPDVLVLGSSRANQWRSAMFRPERFYNAGNAIFLMRDFRRALEELGDVTPRVIIFSIDYFVFLPSYEFVYRLQSREDMGGWLSAELVAIAEGVLAETILRPGAVLGGQHDGVPALGLSARKTGSGFRLDGSYHYGNAGPLQAASAVAGIQNGTQWPTKPAERLDDAVLREFERFTDLARKKGIALVGITMPFVPEVSRAMEQSTLYQAWKQFECPQTKEWIRNQGVVYFDFTKLESFGGKSDEFADPFHPSEPAYLRMLLAMLAEPKFRALFPDLDINGLEERLKHSSSTEVFGNEF